MSEAPSPKPKPGSLRDRIAAFENANKSAVPPTAPAPRPKPSTLQSWKPKAPSPPHSPEPERHTGGMSASDAVESIGKGVSLKERMAALQGKGAFGSVAPAPAPPKPTEKPKWRPPPRPLSPPADEAAPAGDVIDSQRSSSMSAGDPDQAQVEGEHEAQQDAAETEQDSEEEERQRRAAIAARMARLGGARVGMGVPMFGAKPTPPKKPETILAHPKQEEEATIELTPVISPPVEALTSANEESRTDPDYFSGPIRRDSDASSLSLADSASATTPSRSQSSMPVPAGPRRAAPPRKKAYKSPPTPQHSEILTPAAVPEVVENAQDVAPTAEPAAESTSEPEPESVAPPSFTKVTSQEMVETPEQVSIQSSSEQVLATGDVQEEMGEVGKSAEIDAVEVGPVDEREEEEYVSADQPQPAPEQEDLNEEDEEDEEERRRRVAAKLSQMGAINPLAGPPSVSSRESISSPTARRDSVPAPLLTEEPLDVEDEVNVDREEVGESVPPIVSTHVSPQADVEEPEDAREAREADESASHAAEPEDEPQPDLGTTRRVLYHDEMDEEEQYSNQFGRDFNEPEEVPGWLASEADILDVAIPSPSPAQTPRPIPREDKPVEDHLIGSGTRTHAVDSASDEVHEVFAQEPTREQDDDEMAPARIARPIPPPPVNLSSRPSVSLPSPPPPLRAPLYALQADEERPESPAPRPVPPPVKSVVRAAEQAAPPLPSRIARRTSASVSVRSVDMEAPPTPPPVPTSPRPVRRPTSPPIITALPLIVPAPESGVEQAEFVDSETPSHPQEVQEPQEEDDEAGRRRLIAERMARLGGIRFGAPPVPTPLARPTFPRAPPPTSIPPDEPEVAADEPVREIEETSEDETARKQRIVAKLASMGGLRHGMPPPGVGVAPATARRLASKQDDSENEDAALPVPAPAHPSRRPPPPVEVDSEQEKSRGTSDDGVRVELEESEIEEIDYSDEIQASADEETSPLPPARQPSFTVKLADALPTPPRVTSRSPPPAGRPPIPSIPTSLFNRRSSIATRSSSSRKSSVDYSSSSDTPTSKQQVQQMLESVLSDPGIEPQSEYVMVEPGSASEEEPSAPPRRRSFRAPPRAVTFPPPPPPSAIDPPEEVVSSTQWKLPSIPQAASDFSDEGELGSSGFSDDSTFQEQESNTPSMRKSRSRQASGQTARPADQQLSVDELMAVWGKVGVQVVNSATSLFEKSKRSLVGDGSYSGFVRAAIAQVPDAQCVSVGGEDWGYLIYAQTAGSVQRRVAEIMPGDVIAFWDAKLKGHKGLQSYSQTVGSGANGPLVGVVSEVEGKKSKVRVWQANQHVGQQTVENMSYRLEDLKCGHVKVFRVMEV